MRARKSSLDFRSSIIYFEMESHFVALNSLRTLYQTHRNPLVSASPVLRLMACAIIPGDFDSLM